MLDWRRVGLRGLVYCVYENEERVGLYDEILNLYTVVLRSLHRNKLSPKYLAVLVAVFRML